MDRNVDYEKNWKDFCSRNTEIGAKVLVELDMSMFFPNGSSKEVILEGFKQKAKRMCLPICNVISVTLD